MTNKGSNKRLDSVLQKMPETRTQPRQLDAGCHSTWKKTRIPKTVHKGPLPATSRVCRPFCQKRPAIVREGTAILVWPPPS